MQYELERDAKAERDMKLLKKGVVVLKKGNKVCVWRARGGRTCERARSFFLHARDMVLFHRRLVVRGLVVQCVCVCVCDVLLKKGWRS